MTFRKLMIILLLSSIGILCCYAQYIKTKFDKIYAQRNSPYQYDQLYRSGVLNEFKNFVLKNYEMIISLKENSDNKHISLIDLKTHTKDSIEKNAIDHLIRNKFYDVLIDKQNDSIEIEFNKLFFQYKIKPTYHSLLYSTSRNWRYRMNKTDFWYFASVDITEHDFSRFMDFRPEWTLPYFEAFAFFRENPNFNYES